MKHVEWVGSSFKDLTAMDNSVQDSVGYAIERAQAGEIVDYAKPMHGRLRDVIEIRTPDETGDSTIRAAYTTKLGDVVYVLDVFKKKSTHGIKTSQRDLDRIAARLRIAKEHDERHSRET